MEGDPAIRWQGLRDLADASPREVDSERQRVATEGWGAKVLAALVKLTMAKRTLVNVNFPALPADKVRGIRVVRQGFHDYSRGSLVEATDPRGRPYFWFGLQDAEHTLDHGTDLEAVEDGYIAVTPLQLDLTHYAAIDTLAAQFAEGDGS